MGLSEHSIIVAVGGRQTHDAASVAKLLDEEHELLAGRGGTFRVQVHAAGASRELLTTIAAPVSQEPVRGTVRNSVPPATGSINVWDRFGGNRGTGQAHPRK